MARKRKRTTERLVTVVDVQDAAIDPVAAATAHARILWPQAVGSAAGYVERLGQFRLDAERIAGLAPLDRASEDALILKSAGQGASALAACLVLGELGDDDAVARAAGLLDEASQPADARMFKLLWISEPLLRSPRFEPVRAAARRAAAQADRPHPTEALRAALALGVVPAGDDVVARLIAAATGGYDDGWILAGLRQIGAEGDARGLTALQALLLPPLAPNGFSYLSQCRDTRLVPDARAALARETDASRQVQLLTLLVDLGAPDLTRSYALLDTQPESAASLLGDALAGSGDEAAVRMLSQASAAAAWPRSYARAIARIGGELGRRTALGLLPRLTADATEILWRVHGIGVEAVIARFAAAGLAVEPRPGAGFAGYRFHSDTEQVWSQLIAAGAVVEMHYEDDQADPFPRHGLLVAKLQSLAGAALPIEHVSEDAGPDDGQSRLRCVSHGRLYEVTTAYEIRTYDSLAVFALLHRVLQDRGDRRRFVSLPSGDESLRFTFADGEALDAVLRDLWVVGGLAGKERVAELRALGNPAPVRVPAAPRSMTIEIVAPSPVAPSALAALAASLPAGLAHRVDARPGWTTVHIDGVAPAQVQAMGDAAFEAWFERACASVGAHLARTVHDGGWATIVPGELAGEISALDWLQYFGPAFRSRNAQMVEQATRSKSYAIRPREDGSAVVRVPMTPFTHGWREREDAAFSLTLRLRPMPEEAEEVVSHEARLRDVQPPAPRAWSDGDRAEMLAARTATLDALRAGFADDALFARFERTYVADGAASAPLLDRVESWREYYGADPAAIALRASVRAASHDPAAASRQVVLTADQLETCVKAIAWSAEMPAGDLEVLVEYMVATGGPPAFVREFTEADAVAGFMKLTRAFLSRCSCAGCVEKRSRLTPTD
jgi:hypothetical protein